MAELLSVISAPSVRVSAYSSQYILSSFGPVAHHADALSERAVCTAAGPLEVLGRDWMGLYGAL